MFRCTNSGQGLTTESKRFVSQTSLSTFATWRAERFFIAAAVRKKHIVGEGKWGGTRGATHDSGEDELRAEERKSRGGQGGGVKGSKTSALTSRGGSSYLAEG